jgi:DNA (cytosine-5)-methyltransferase 1
LTHLGDICQINGANIEPVDCIIGGSPCQDLSVAGKRAGLSGKRSGLFMEQMRIVKEMRDADKRSGRTTQFIRPRFMVWENVPGAFSSSQGEDFRAVLEEIARVEAKDTVIPRPPKGKWSTVGAIMGDGWSIAWRVLDAQFWGVPQRRRRIALVADFGGQSAPEILFEREGVSGDPSEGGEEGEGTAGGVEGGAGEAIAFQLSGDRDNPSVSVSKKAFCIPANPMSDRGQAVCYGFKLGNSEQARSIGLQAEMSPTLNAECGGNKPAILDMTHACDVIRECGDVVPSLQARMGTGGNQIPLVMAHGQANAEIPYDQVPTLNCNHEQPIVAAVDCRNGTENPDINGTLQSKPNGGTSYNLQNVCREGNAVRRLTPLECERLQGFPDNWTNIPKASDSARYKALGNSIALPPWRWVLRRLCKQIGRRATLGSLFDGIGGFPKIWEEINGKGSAVWASEIEPFPIAVTKYHFGA